MLRNIDWLERGTGVMPEDILEAEKQCGFKIEPGDVLLVRTGQYHRRKIEGPANPLEAGSTACHAASLPLFREKDIAMLCANCHRMIHRYQDLSVEDLKELYIKNEKRDKR